MQPEAEPGVPPSGHRLSLFASVGHRQGHVGQVTVGICDLADGLQIYAMPLRSAQQLHAALGQVLAGDWLQAEGPRRLWGADYRSWVDSQSTSSPASPSAQAPAAP